MEFLTFDKYAFYIWASYFLTFAVIAFLFISTKTNHTQVLTKLRIKYTRDKNNND